jgi:hypothetical protein
MKINPFLLSIPPYISTSWKNIASLHVEYENNILFLIVNLINGTRIAIPNLDKSIIEIVFNTHAKYLEQEQTSSRSANPLKQLGFPQLDQMIAVDFPMQAGFSLNNMGSVLQHNSEQANTPDLPPDLLEKVSSLAKTIGVDDPRAIPQPEPHCNCFYCQIARAMRLGIEEKGQEKEKEEIVSDEDLKFRTWDISQAGDKLFTVTNPIDAKEHYSVYLGDPLGCTCGQNHCEHIRAVLNS